MMCCWGLTSTSNMASRISENCSWRKQYQDWCDSLCVTEANSRHKVQSCFSTWSRVLKSRMCLQASWSLRRCSSVLGFTTRGSESSSSSSSGLYASAHTAAGQGTCSGTLLSGTTLPMLFITDLKLCECIYRWWTLQRDMCYCFTGAKLNYNL